MQPDQGNVIICMHISEEIEKKENIEPRFQCCLEIPKLSLGSAEMHYYTDRNTS